jgi:hypothetical protein
MVLSSQEKVKKFFNLVGCRCQVFWAIFSVAMSRWQEIHSEYSTGLTKKASL